MSSKLRNIGNQTVSGALGFELLIQPGQNRVHFPDLELLRSKNIKFIDVCSQVITAPSHTPIFNVFTNHSYITLRKKTTQNNTIERLSLSQLFTSLRRGNRLKFNDVFDFPASYIEIPQNNITQPSVIFFVVWFDEPFVANVVNPKDKKEISYFEVSLKNRRTMFDENRTLFRKKFQSLMLSFPRITAENQPGIHAVTSYQSYLTLQRKNMQFIQNVPLYLFNQTENAYMLNLQNIMFDFTNSFIDVASNNPETFLSQSVFFNCIVVD